MISFSDAVKICFTKKFVKTSGRASRAEFWWFYLFRGLQLPWYVLGFLIAVTNPHNDIANIFGNIFFGVGIIFSLITCIPYTCVFIRRLHDKGHSALWLLRWLLRIFLITLLLEGLGFVFSSQTGFTNSFDFDYVCKLTFGLSYFVGLIVNIFKGNKGPNQYGPDPLDPQSQKINPQPITEGIMKVTIIEDKQTEEIIDVEL